MKISFNGGVIFGKKEFEKIQNTPDYAKLVQNRSCDVFVSTPHRVGIFFENQNGDVENLNEIAFYNSHIIGENFELKSRPIACSACMSMKTFMNYLYDGEKIIDKE